MSEVGNVLEAGSVGAAGVSGAGSTLVPAPVVAGVPVLAVGDSFGGFVPALLADAGERAATSFVNFFTASIENPNKRSAYLRA